ncbi:MAG: hydrogenase maturation protease [Bacteroidota bacterium]
MKKLLILGMGNKLFGDDGVGIVVAERLREIYNNYENIDIEETSWGGFRIIDLLDGYNTAIVIDALQTKRKHLGFVHKLDYQDLIHSVRMVSFHDINFATAIEFAKIMDITMPEKIMVFGIEVDETDHFSEEISPIIKRSVESCINMVVEEIESLQVEEVEN